MILTFDERDRERLDLWNPWAMESSGDELRDYILESFEACERYKQVQLLLQRQRPVKLRKTCTKSLNIGASYT
jgi:hypothetical protein